MSHFDYAMSKHVAEDDPPFAAFIMAALRKADSTNAAKIEAAWPNIAAEMRARYNAAGGRLDGDPPMTALSTAEAVLARVAGEHRMDVRGPVWGVWWCVCGKYWTSAHVAAEQIAALTNAMGLVEQCIPVRPDEPDTKPIYSLLTDWEPTAGSEDDDPTGHTGPDAEHHADRDDREYGELRDRRAEG